MQKRLPHFLVKHPPCYLYTHKNFSQCRAEIKCVKLIRFFKTVVGFRIL